MFFRNLEIAAAVALEDITSHDQADKPLEIVTVSDKVVRQQLKARRIRAGQRNVVNRIDQRPAKHQGPDAIHRRAGERFIPRMRDPAGELSAACAMAVEELFFKG